MLSAIQPARCSLVWRLTNVASALFVCSFIFFEVLDLDGSDFVRLQLSVPRTVFLAEVTDELVGPRKIDYPRTNLLYLAADWPSKFKIIRQTKAFGIAALDWANYHGFRIGSPPDLVADAVPDH